MLLKPPPGVFAATCPTLSAAARALIVLALLAPLAFYFGTARSIVAIWNSSETFAHGYVVPPLALWLVWRRRALLASTPLKPWWPALCLVAGAGMVWLLATLAEVQVVRQYALVAMLPLTVLAVCGRRFAGALAFPLLFLLFAVPFGEVFVAPLIEFTADFTIAALRLTGIPVLRNGPIFEIPTGSWAVVEACSGVRYLIASITLGSLYAYLSYRSWRRRALFIALSVVVPIVANGLRAYMIVMIGHLSSMRLAAGVDHIIYGWLFFGLVMFVMFWIGSHWQQDEPAAPATGAARIAPETASTGAIARMTLALFALAALWPALALLNDRVTVNPNPPRLAAPALAWQPAPGFSDWTPDYQAPDARLDATWRAPATAPSAAVRLTVLYYRNQHNGKALISSVNRLAGEHSAFHETASTVRVETIGGKPFTLREATLAGPGGQLLVWHWMRVDGRTTTNGYLGKLWQARARLLLHGDDGAAVIVSTPLGENPDAARNALRAFLDASLAPIDAALVAAEGR
jgi:exosortase A